MASTPITRTINPYPQLADQVTAGLDAIALELGANPSIDEFVTSIYTYIQPLYYPVTGSVPKALELEITSVIINSMNTYSNDYANSIINFSNIPVNAFDKWLKNAEDELGLSRLPLEEQSPLFFALEVGKAVYNYWIEKTSTPGDWSTFFEADAYKNYINILIWTEAAMIGAMNGASASKRGLIAPTTDIVSVNIVSALIGAITIGASKVIYKTTQRVNTNLININLTPVNLTDDRYTPFLISEPTLPNIQETVITTKFRDGSKGCDYFDDRSRNQTNGWPVTDLKFASPGICH